MAKEKGFHHFSDSYFQDHSKKIVLGADGNARVEYVYEGIYYTMEGTDRQWLRGKVRYLLLSAAAAALLLVGMTTETALNRVTDVMLLQIFSLFLFLGLGIGVVNRLTVPRSMTKWEYRMGVATVKECSLLLVWSLGVLLLDGCGALVFGRIGFDWKSAQVLLEILGGLLLILCQYRLVKKERYREEISDDLPTGTDITSDFGPVP